MAITEAISYNPESSLTLNEKAESLCVKMPESDLNFFSPEIIWPTDCLYP